MASQTKNQTAFQAMKKGWKRAVKVITKPARILMEKIRKRQSNEKEPPVDEPSAEIDQPVQQDVCYEIVPYQHTNDPEVFLTFNNLENGELASTDKYLRHVKLCGKYKNAILYWTDKRFLVVSEFGKIEWQKEKSKIHSSPFIVNCCCPEQPYDRLVIPYKEPKMVINLGWDSSTSRFYFAIKTKNEKVFEIQQHEVIANGYFKNNNLIRFCKHHK